MSAESNKNNFKRTELGKCPFTGAGTPEKERQTESGGQIVLI